MSIDEAMSNLRRAQQEAAFELGRSMGFGELMYAVSRLWQGTGDPRALAIGPSVKKCVPCDHQGAEDAGGCAWCGGCGWVTKRVKELQDQAGEKKEAPDESGS